MGPEADTDKLIADNEHVLIPKESETEPQVCVYSGECASALFGENARPQEWS